MFAYDKGDSALVHRLLSAREVSPITNPYFQKQCQLLDAQEDISSPYYMHLVGLVLSHITRHLQSDGTQMHKVLCGLTVLFARRHIQSIGTDYLEVMAELLTIQARGKLNHESTGVLSPDAHATQMEALAHAVRHLKHSADSHDDLYNNSHQGFGHALYSSLETFLRHPMLGAPEGEHTGELGELRRALWDATCFQTFGRTLALSLKAYLDKSPGVWIGDALAELSVGWRGHISRTLRMRTDPGPLVVHAQFLQDACQTDKSHRQKLAMELVLINLMCCPPPYGQSAQGTLLNCARILLEEGLIWEACETVGHWVARTQGQHKDMNLAVLVPDFGILQVYSCMLRDTGRMLESCNFLGQLVCLRASKSYKDLMDNEHRYEDWVAAGNYVKHLTDSDRILDLRDAVDQIQLPGRDEGWDWSWSWNPSEQPEGDLILDIVTTCMTKALPEISSIFQH